MTVFSKYLPALWAARFVAVSLLIAAIYPSGISFGASTTVNDFVPVISPFVTLTVNVPTFKSSIVSLVASETWATSLPSVISIVAPVFVIKAPPSFFNVNVMISPA